MSASADTLLSTPLAQLQFPARMAHFIERRGLSTVRDLIAMTPASLFIEPNLGRKSVADTRAIVKAHLGITWEAARTSFVVPTSHSAPPPPPTPAEEWSTLPSRLPPELLERAVVEVEELPTRIHTFARRQQLERTSQLLAVAYDDLAKASGVGVGTLRAALAFFRAQCTRSLPPPPAVPLILREVEDPLPPGSTWRSLLHDALRDLAATERLILTQRSGLAGPIPTLAELGELLGVSRERVRQLESRALERVRRMAWRDPAKDRLTVAAPATVATLSAWKHDDELFLFSEEEVEACHHRRRWVPLSTGSPVSRDPPADSESVLRLSCRAP
jgi:DNA-directed RNA polymerase specialized sigma24 family protein